jgi:hypothetical protein
MAISWYPDDDHSHGLHGLIIDVCNPGDGEIELYGDRQPARTVRGHHIGRVLGALTSIAFAGEFGRNNVEPIGPLTQAQARVLLPYWQSAAIYAAGGTNAAESVLEQEQEFRPPAFCSRCAHGSVYASDDNINAWCLEHGHRWFAGNAPKLVDG